MGFLNPSYIGVSVKELYSDMAVEKVEATIHASSSSIEQGSSDYLLYLML